jgi:hypothetical protein
VKNCFQKHKAERWRCGKVLAHVQPLPDIWLHRSTAFSLIRLWVAMLTRCEARDYVPATWGPFPWFSRSRDDLPDPPRLDSITFIHWSLPLHEFQIGSRIPMACDCTLRIIESMAPEKGNRSAISESDWYDYIVNPSVSKSILNWIARAKDERNHLSC